MKHGPVRVMATVAAAGLLAACGSSSGGSGDAAPYVDAMMKSYDDSDSDVKDALNRSQAECVAKDVIDAVGVDTLKDNGVTPKDVAGNDSPFEKVGKSLSREQALKVADVFTDGRCFDLIDLVMKSAEADGSNPFGKLKQSKVKCLFTKLLAGEEVKEAFANSMLGRDDSSDAISKAMSDQSKIFSAFGDCDISPSELE